MEAHEVALEYGGAPGIINRGLIESAIARPYTGYYRTISKKGAALTESVCRNHAFTDGNKRTCLALLNLLLERSGYRLHPVADEDLGEAVENLMIAVANGQMTFAQIEQWLKVRIKKKPAK